MPSAPKNDSVRRCHVVDIDGEPVRKPGAQKETSVRAASPAELEDLAEAIRRHLQRSPGAECRSTTYVAWVAWLAAQAVICEGWRPR